MNFTATVLSQTIAADDSGLTDGTDALAAGDALTSTNGVTALTSRTYELVFTAGSSSVTLSHTFQAGDDPAAGELLAALETQFANLSDAQKAGFSIDTTSDKLQLIREDGKSFRVDYGANHNAALDVEYGDDEDITTDDLSALGETGTTIANGSEAVGDTVSVMYMSLSGADTYSVTFEDTSDAHAIVKTVDFSWDGTQAGLSNVASTISAALTATGDDNGDASFGHSTRNYDFSAVVEDGTLKIADAQGNGFQITGFTSAGAGRAAVSNGPGQTAGGSSSQAILDDTEFDTTATSLAAGTAVDTEINIEFSGDDIYSFEISDGSATAVISNIGVGTYSNTEGTATGVLDEMVGAINAALDRVGLGVNVGGTIEATIGAPLTDSENIIESISLVDTSGKEVTISNFRSDNSGIASVTSAASTTDGINRYLDDGNGTSSEVVANIDVSTQDGAASALDIIDRALDDINIERAELGAVSNRLDHTISNLGNIVVNTEAAQSRIEDADFAAETGNLTKAQILSQAATAMLAQANASKQSVLSLLQG